MRCKGLYCVDLGESFQMNIYLQKSASIQKRTSHVKFAPISRVCHQIRNHYMYLVSPVSEPDGEPQNADASFAALSTLTMRSICQHLRRDLRLFSRRSL